jgi:L-alanine-DL-glutamate epimerase-like enolase superfamily enzyme
MPRVDQAWKTASYSGTAVEGFALEVTAGLITGVGGTAAHVASIGAEVLAGQLEGEVSQTLLGSDPFLGSTPRQKLTSSDLHSRTVIAADIAMHDLVGKLLGVSCHVLWGGATRTLLPIVRMVGIKELAELETTVGVLADQGFHHLKIKIGTGIDEDVDRVRHVRETFGPATWISVDGNGAYSPEDAILLSHRLEPYDVKLLEQPVNYADIDGLTKVTANSGISIMADQCVNDVASALDICQRNAAHVISVKLTKMGTIDVARRVTDLCEAFGVGVHLGGSAAPVVVDVAQTYLAATLPWISEECEVGEHLAVRGDPFVGVEIKEGCFRVGDAPGFGLTLPAFVD